MVDFTTVTGPVYWASYLVNGDASGLQEGEQAKVDAWLAREGIRQVVDIARDEDGEGQEPRFTWHMRLHAPELDCEGGDVVDYVCELVTQ